MATICDFKGWLDFVELENYEEIYCIYRSVTDIDEWGAFKCTEKKTSKGSMFFLKCDYCDDTLMLASEKARELFPKRLQVGLIRTLRISFKNHFPKKAGSNMKIAKLILHYNPELTDTVARIKVLEEQLRGLTGSM